MSAPTVLLIERDRLFVTRADGTVATATATATAAAPVIAPAAASDTVRATASAAVAAPRADVAYESPRDARGSGEWTPDTIVVAVQSLVPTPRALRVVVGGAWLECAPHGLPPLAPGERRRAVHFQAPRLFAVDAPLAMTVDATIAVACDAAWLASLLAALRPWCGDVVVVGLPEVVRATGQRGTWSTPAGADEQLIIRVEGIGATASLASVRRTRGDAAGGDAAGGNASVGATPVGTTPLPIASTITAYARLGGTVPADRQLLDLPGEAAVAATVRTAWWRAMALLTAAALFAGWALEQHRDRVLAATEQAVADAARRAAPALAAAERLQRARAEGDALRDADVVARADSAPSHVLARLGQLLPPSAFVQHLEWDGRTWRVDGSASDAALLVPRLDADPVIDAVRSLAPSTRFLDGGAPRSSFSIGFVVKGAPRDSAGAQAASGPGGSPRGN